MRTIKTFSSLIVAAVIVMAIAIGFVTRAGAASVEPVVVPGNPNCTDLGYDFGFKPQPEPPGSGTYFFADGVNSVTIDSDGVYFDWSSTLGVDAVLVKGGDGSNAYVYDPPAEAFADTDLHSPTNPNNGEPYEISHIEFCYDYEVDVAKDAATTYTRTYLWDIAKSVDPDTWWMFAGDSGTSGYTVDVTQTGYEDSDWAVSGSITVANNTPFDATITGVADEISGAGAASVDCGVAFPYLLAAGDTLVCSYSSALPDASDRLNTATATTEGIVGGNAGTADVIFGAPTTEVNASVNVSDSWYGDLGEFSDSGSATYDRTFTCSSNPADYTDGHLVTTYPNTATIDETGQNSSASVDVHCYIPDAAKDAATTYTRTFLWDIAKSVDPAEWSMFAGESGTSGYLVEVTQTGYEDSDWFVSGTITVHNPNPMADLTVAVGDVISPDIVPALSCGGSLLVPAGGSATCDYEATLPDGSDRVNTATVTMNGIDFTATADVTFGDPSNEVNPTVNVSDSWYGDLGEFSGSGTATYDRTFTCSSNPADYTDGHLVTTYPNTATIDETGQDSSASVDVHCYIPDVAKDAHTSYNRDYSWTIDKTADASDLLLMVGQQFLVNYQVTVDATYTDSGWAVNGTITVNNPNPAADVTVSVSDVISPDIIPALSCGGSLLVPAGGSATCDYAAALPDASDRVNTATITMNGIDFTATADVTFGDPSVVTDECITVDDDQYGALGEVCADQAPATFDYSMYIGPYNTCGLYQFVNTASFVTNDTGSTGSDSWTVNVDVPCLGGCTLTQGYWKTHSSYGPAPYDDTWALVGEDTPFYLSGQSWYEVFWTAPQGNAYYILAHQYMAATLNQLNGAASTPEVDAALAWAADFFSTHTPSDNLGPLRNQVLQNATLLDDYNNGLVGPGHCSE